MKLQINPSQLSPLDRLRYVGKNGMGALKAGVGARSRKEIQSILKTN